MNGIDCRRHLAQDLSFDRIPIFLISGVIQEAVIEEARQEGFTAILYKPLEVDHLLRLMVPIFPDVSNTGGEVPEKDTT